MANLYGSKKAKGDKVEKNFDAVYPGVSQKVAVGAASAQSSALGSKTTIVRLVADTDCFILIGSNPTALSDGTNAFLPKGVVEYFGVDGGEKIAVIEATATGTLYITEGA